MTDKELRKLNRTELLELLIDSEKRNEELQAELEHLREAKSERQIRLSNAGSIAEAALEINGVLQAAQAAADQYLESIEEMRKEAQMESQRMLDEARAKCAAMEEKARRECEALVADVQNGVFQAAQAAVDQYMKNIQSMKTDAQLHMEQLLNHTVCSDFSQEEADILSALECAGFSDDDRTALQEVLEKTTKDVSEIHDEATEDSPDFDAARIGAETGTA